MEHRRIPVYDIYRRPSNAPEALDCSWQSNQVTGMAYQTLADINAAIADAITKLRAKLYPEWDQRENG